MEITQQQFKDLCFWIHKYFRTCDKRGHWDIWKAINALNDEEWADAVKSGLEEAGITIEHKMEEDDMMLLYWWFRDNSVPSISPQTGIGLATIRDGIAKRLDGIKNETTKHLLKKYVDNIDEVCVVAAIHQKAVIDTFEQLIHKGGMNEQEKKKGDDEKKEKI